MFDIKPVQFVLLKVASRCNINCSYCYWFKDKTVYESSKVIMDEVLDAFYIKLKNHICKYSLETFSISLHGGEPLLAGKNKINKILSELRKIEEELNIKLNIFLQTNATIIDEEWIKIFLKYDIHLGVSIDGPKDINDISRIDFSGNSTHEIIIKNIRILKSSGVKIGVLAVCNPETDPAYICEYFVKDLKLDNFDILIPDANYNYESIPYIKDFYIKLFRLWFEKYSRKDVKIRFAKTILEGLLGRSSKMQSIGYNVVDICMIKTDGQIEVLDFLHVLGDGVTRNQLNILTNEINDITLDPFWLEVYSSSLNLNQKCVSCKYSFACGGGHIASRWSSEKHFDNPSIYCDQLYEIFDSSLKYLKQTLQNESTI